MRRWANHNCLLVSLMIVTRTTYTFSSLRVGLKLRRKSECLRTKTPKINTPGVPYAQKWAPLAYLYAQFKKLNGSPISIISSTTNNTASPSPIVRTSNGSHETFNRQLFFYSRRRVYMSFCRVIGSATVKTFASKNQVKSTACSLLSMSLHSSCLHTPGMITCWRLSGIELFSF